MPLVTGSPKGPLANAIFVALKADASLVALATGGIYEAMPRATRVSFPYVHVGERNAETNTGAMQREGSDVRVTVHVWSEARGAAECEAIQSRIRAVLQRANLPVTGFLMLGGSLVCDTELCIPDVDPDMPERSLYHGVQQWIADLQELEL